MNSQRQTSQRVYHQLVLCAILSLAIVLPRSLLIARAHSPTLDADEHLDQGLAYLRGQPHPQAYYDPPLGKMILAVPLWIAGCHVEIQRFRECGLNRERRTVQYNQPLSPQTLQYLQAGWKALLFVPCVMVVFAWCRRLYGAGAGWLAAAIVLTEPNIAAHIAATGLDVFAMEAVIIAAFLAWRYIKKPTLQRMAAASFALAAAMLVKNTALLLPLGIVTLAILEWLLRPVQSEPVRFAARLRRVLNRIAGAALLTMFFIWALALFDFSQPALQRQLTGIEYTKGFDLRRDVIDPATTARWPAGVYIASLIGGFEHTGDGHSGYLWGEFREHGWWYYFGAVALYKVPLGIWFILALALFSLIWNKPRWDELSLFVPMLACAALIMSTGYNVGFRHALPAYGLGLMLLSRCVGRGTARTLRVLAWLGVVAAALHALSVHPDYLTYTNGWSRRPYLAISDSNVDWAHSVKQIGRWLDANPQAAERIVWIDLFNDIADPAIDHYVGGRVRRVCDEPPPRSGILILGPPRLIGLYDPGKKYRHFIHLEPVDVIGHCLLVYDLDAIAHLNKEMEATHGTIERRIPGR